MTINSDLSDEHLTPYQRLGGVVSTHKLWLLRLVNIILCTTLFLLILVLLLSIRPRDSSFCLCPGPGSRCFWPFARSHQLVLISMDGFRHDYLEIVRQRLGPDALPNFARLEARGVRANRSINAFPTVTLPNHRTLLTGLYPEHHGTVSNTVRDTRWPRAILDMDNQTSLNQEPWLVNWPEPIWVTLQRAGGLAGSLLWPLTDQPVNGDLPFQQVSQFTLLDSSSVQYPYRKRVQDMLWWLDNPRYRIDLVLAYFDEPDETGHAYGPMSKELAEKIVELDSVLGQLLDGLQDHNLLDEVDIVLTADHGMSAMSKDRIIPMDDYVDPSLYSYTQLGTVGLLYPVPGKENEVYTKLKGANEHMQVYWRADVPAFLHYSENNTRMPPIVVIPDPQWCLVHKKNDSVGAGNHGFSTNFTEMHPFLIASGPSFLSNVTVSEVHAVDLYPLMCRLLRFRPQPNNGSLDRVATALLKPHVADRLLAFEHWPEWFFWLALEVELLWLFFMLALLFTVIAMLAASLRMQVRYSRVLVVDKKETHEEEDPLL